MNGGHVMEMVENESCGRGGPIARLQICHSNLDGSLGETSTTNAQSKV